MVFFHKILIIPEEEMVRDFTVKTGRYKPVQVMKASTIGDGVI